MSWSSTADDPAARARLRQAETAAWICLAVNLAASLAMALVLRHGTTLVPLDERVTWVRTHLGAWRAGWILWVAAGPTLVLFYVMFANTLAQDMLLVRRAGAIVALLGVAADWVAEYAYMVTLPILYAKLDPLQPDLADQIRKWEAYAEILTGGLANGLYTVGGAMLAFAAYGTAGFPRALCWASLPVWLFGVALSVSSLMRRPQAMGIATAGVMAAFLLWLGAVALAIRRRRASLPAPVDKPAPAG